MNAEAEENEFRETEEFLRANDPAVAVSGGFSAEQTRRVVRFMRHPFWATIYLHHRSTAFCVAVAVVAAIVAVLLKTVFFPAPEFLPPVDIVAEDPDAAAQLDPEPETPRDLPENQPNIDIPETEATESSYEN